MFTAEKMVPELRKLWSLKRGEVTAVIGAGGKTSTINLLSREFRFSGVIYTTTTAVLLPDNIPHRIEIVESAQDLLTAVKKYKYSIQTKISVAEVLVVGRKLTPARPGSDRSNKLLGLEADWLNSLEQNISGVKVLVEADGAASHRIKAPAEHEPVIPEITDNLIVIQGASALGRKLNSPHCFRTNYVKNNMPENEIKNVNLKLYQLLFTGFPGYGDFVSEFAPTRLVLTQCERQLFQLCRRLDWELRKNSTCEFEGFTALNYNEVLEIVYHNDGC